MKEFFVSDLHIGHENCLRFDNRPFKTLAEQNEKMIEIWNSRVQPNDHVWLLGDILWFANKENEDVLKALNGKKYLVTGNHDGRMLKVGHIRNLFEEIHEGYHKMHDQKGRTLILSHYPIIQFDGVMRGNIHLYGHIHVNQRDNAFIEKWKKEYEEGMTGQACNSFKVNMYNVGFAVPYMEWGPKTLDEILEANK